MRQLCPKGRQSGRIELAQAAAQLIDEPLPTPDQVLLQTSQYLQRRRLVRVACDRAVVVPIGPHEVG